MIVPHLLAAPAQNVGALIRDVASAEPLRPRSRMRKQSWTCPKARPDQVERLVSPRGGNLLAGSVPGFVPSTSGFHFNNAFPRVPLRFIGIPGLIRVSIGDASNGLCGGMAFAARDYFEAGRPPPRVNIPPGSGRLFDYLVARLLDSFNLPLGPARYLELMNPALPDGEPILRWVGLGPHGRAWRMALEEWPKVRSDIDAGQPSPLGLVLTKSLDPFDLKENHQVLAYAYELEDQRLTLGLYDPNQADRDDVSLSVSLDDPRRPANAIMSPHSTRVYSFFRVDYRPATPP